jgi:hypothetical protein
VTPTRDGENPPNARHWYGDALRDPKRRLKEPPSETRIWMVKLLVFNKMVEMTAQIKVSQKYGMAGLHLPC